MLLRRNMEPFRVLLVANFKLGSESWEQLQRARAAAHSSDPETKPPRRYRAGVAASTEVEAEFFLSVGALFGSPEPWSQLPLDAINFEFRSLAFRLLSRPGWAQPSPTCCGRHMSDVR